MFLQRIGFAFLIVSIMAACSGGSASVNQSSTVTTASLPPEPDRTANNATLAGIDTDGDGVRDDIQRLIFKTYTSATKRTLATALAKETRKLYVTPPTTPAEARKIADDEHKITDCIYSRSDIPLNERFSLVGLMEASHADTADRMKTYINYNNLLHGQTFYLRDSEPGICNGILP